MDFEPDETQRAVAELAAGVLAKEAGRAGVLGEDAWQALAGVGLLSVALPAELGGDGLGAGEVAALLTEAGRRAASVPALATLALGVLPLVRFGTAGQQRAWLPGAAAGTSLLTGTPSEPAAPLATSPRTTAEPGGEGWRLTGTKAAVPYAEQAVRMLTPAALPGGQATVFLVDPHGDGVELRRTPTSSGDPEYTVRLDGAAAEPLGPQPSGDTVAALRAFALLGAAAVADGLLAGAMQLATEHVRERQQFGRPLATFQAVAQQVADVYIAARTLHLTATSAAWRLSAGLDAREDLELAGLWLCTEGLQALRVCHHLHGGIGVDVTYPLHRYYARLKDLARFVGGASQRLEGVAACTSN
ncbi:MAG: acyl-CoA dehydrogenase family protein [Thermocrispum sp.]